MPSKAKQKGTVKSKQQNTMPTRGEVATRRPDRHGQPIADPARRRTSSNPRPRRRPAPCTAGRETVAAFSTPCVPCQGHQSGLQESQRPAAPFLSLAVRWTQSGSLSLSLAGVLFYTSAGGVDGRTKRRVEQQHRARAGRKQLTPISISFACTASTLFGYFRMNLRGKRDFAECHCGLTPFCSARTVLLENCACTMK